MGIKSHFYLPTSHPRKWMHQVAHINHPGFKDAQLEAIFIVNGQDHTHRHRLCGLPDYTLLPDWWRKSVKWISHAYTVSSACVCLVWCPYTHTLGCQRHQSLSLRRCGFLSCRLHVWWKMKSLSPSLCGLMMLAVIVVLSRYLVISTWTPLARHRRLNARPWKAASWPPVVRLRQPALSDTPPERTWRRHPAGTKWSMSSDGGGGGERHPAHWLIVLNNEAYFSSLIGVGRCEADSVQHGVSLALSDACSGGRSQISIFFFSIRRFEQPLATWGMNPRAGLAPADVQSERYRAATNWFEASLPT